MAFEESNNVKIIRKLIHQIHTERTMGLFMVREMFDYKTMTAFAKNFDKGLASKNLCHRLFNRIQIGLNGYQRIN